MNNDLLLNSGQVLRQNWELIFGILVCIVWGTLLIFASLKKITGTRFTDPELTALALSGWPLPALLISLLLLLLRIFLPAHLVLILGITLMIVSAGLALCAVWGKVSASFVVPIFVFLSFVFIRLGFVAGALLPAYFDSAEHYRIIQALLNISNGTEFFWPATSYYHLGYHIIVAAFTASAQADLARVMLLFGQIILAGLPLPMYFLVRRATGSERAAIAGVALAAFGWFMPAHSVNWGKYPALLSLLAIQFVLGVMLTKNRWMIAFSLVAAIFIHTRAAILLIILLAAWSLSRTRRPLILALGLAGLGMLTLLFARDPILAPLVEPYKVPVTLLIGLLAVLAYRAFPRLTVASVLVPTLMLAGVFIPITSAISLLDRPLVEMMLFLPLAFLGGLGAARLPKPAVILLIAAILFNAWTAYSFAPSSCCQLAGRDDVIALNWVKQNTPTDANFAIASANLSLTSSTSMLATGTDAGIWVTPLTGRLTLSLPYFVDFSQSDVHNYLCEKKVTDIYIGGTQQSFESGRLLGRPDWYGVIFTLPKAQIVRVLGCLN